MTEERVEEEAVGEEEEAVEPEVEEAGEGEEAAGEDEEVVAKPAGDPVLEYVYLRSLKPPPRTWQWLQLVREARRFEAMALEAEARGLADRAREWRRLASRYAALAYAQCPYRLGGSGCPVFDALSFKCPAGLERRCRARATARHRRRGRRR